MAQWNNICLLATKAFWEKMYYLSQKINWWHTVMWTVKNAVEKSRNIKSWDLLSSIDWLFFVSTSLNQYNKILWKDMVKNLGNWLLQEAKEVLDPIATKIANWENVDLSKFKKDAQLLWRDTKTVKEMIEEDWEKIAWQIKNAAIYYAATTIKWYADAYWDMLKTINQYQDAVKEWIDVYPYFFSESWKEIYKWMVANMQNMFDSIPDLEKFIQHSSQQDALRLLENFNHEPLKWISDIGDESAVKQSMEKFAKLFSNNWKDLWISESDYKTLIRVMNWYYDPISAMTWYKWWKIYKTIVKTSADARRFSTGVLNHAMSFALLWWAWAWYWMQTVWAYSHWLYNLWKLDKVRDIIWYPKENVFGMSTRADMNDLISSWLGSWDLSYLNALSKKINSLAKTELEKLWISAHDSAMIWEAAWEALKWLHNIPDSLFKLTAQNTALAQALRQMWYVNENAFIAHHKASSIPDVLAQELRRLTDENLQIAVWFFWPATWNVSKFNDMPFVKHLMYLASWWLNMSQNFFNLTIWKPLWDIINSMVWHMRWAWWWLADSFEKLRDHYMKDPRVTSLFKTLYYTMFIWHKIQMLIDEDDKDDTPIKRASKSFWTYWWRWNNYLQAIESNRVWRLWLVVANSFNSPFMEWSKVTWIIAGMFKEMARDFMSVHKWSSMFVNAIAAAAEWTFDEWWFSMKMFKDFANEWMTQARWMNRYFINQTISSLDSHNVPISLRDNWSMMLWTNVNKFQEIEQHVRDASDSKKLEEQTWKWLFNTMLYNNAIFWYIKNLVNKYDPKATEEWTQALFDRLSALQVMSDEWLLPMEIPGDKDKTNERYTEINDAIKYMWVYWWSKDDTLSTIFADSWIRNPENFEWTYEYNTLNTLADTMLKLETSPEKLFALEKLRDSDIKWKRGVLAWELMLRYAMAHDWSYWKIALNKMAYAYRKALESQFVWWWYAKNSDLTESQTNAINKAVAEKFWKYIQMVDINSYTSLMKSYVEANPAFDGLKVFKDNGALKWDIQNAYKAVLFTMATITNWWNKDPETITQIKNLTQSLYDIKDEWWKMHTVWLIYDMLEQSWWIDHDSKIQIEARMFKEIAPSLWKASWSEQFYKEHEDIINKMLDMQHWTESQIQQLKDNDYYSQAWVYNF